MKRFAPGVVLAVVIFMVAAPFVFAASSAATKRSGEKVPGTAVATAISTVTGIAISPLLGTAGYGAYKWSIAKDEAARAALPWYAQPKFWVPALLLVGLCAAKDTFGATLPPGWKKPLDVLETLENKFSGLIAAGAVIPLAMDAFSKLLLEQPSAGLAPVMGFPGLASLPLAAFDLSWLLDLLTVPFGIAVFAVVWLASHAINVLILLSPWGAIDAALKLARTALLGLVTLSATINPWAGAILSLVVIAVSLCVAGWAFRLTTCGTVFCWDFLTRRRTRFAPATEGNLMFAGAGFPGVPVRTYGRLIHRPAGGLEFVYRPWLMLKPQVAAVPLPPSELAIGQGFIFSDVLTKDEGMLFSLPPRYRGHEHELVRAYGLGGGVRPAGIRKAWSALREMLGGRAAPHETMAA